MIEVKQLGSNVTEIFIDGDSPKLVIVSYETPVLYWQNGHAYVTTEKHSRTTTKHINKWLADNAVKPERVIPVPQCELDSVLC